MSILCVCPETPCGHHPTPNRPFNAMAEGVAEDFYKAGKKETGMQKLSSKTITLTRLATQIADRFERLGVDEEGKMDSDDKKLLAAVRKQVDAVLTEPMKEIMSGKSRTKGK